MNTSLLDNVYLPEIIPESGFPLSLLLQLLLSLYLATSIHISVTNPPVLEGLKI